MKTPIVYLLCLLLVAPLAQPAEIGPLGGYSTDAGALIDMGLAERNLVGTGIDASINGVLAQRRSSVAD